MPTTPTDHASLASLSHLQSLALDQIADSVTITDLHGIITYVNDAQCRSLKRPRQELIGQSVLGYGDDPARGATQREIIERTLADGHWRGEVVNFDREGRPIVVDCRTQLVRDSAGQPVAMFGVATDITKQKDAARDIQAQRDLFEAVFESAPGLMLVVNQENRVQLANLAVAEMFGGSAAEIRDMLGGEVFRCLNALQTQCGQGPACAHCPVRTRVMRTFQTGQRVVNEEGSLTVLIEGQQQERHFLISTSPLKFDGQQMVLVAINDITDRKHAEAGRRETEERFRTLIEHAPDAIFVQTEGRFRYLNPPAVRLFGANSPEELIGTEFWLRTAPEFHEAVRERIRRQREDGKPVPPMAQDMLRLDGSRVPVETTAVPIRFEGQIAHLVFVRDISKRKRAEAALQQSEAKYRTLFSALVSGFALHEIAYDNAGEPVDYVTLEVNPAFERLLHVPAAAVVGKRAYQAVPDLDRHWLEMFSKVAATGEPCRYLQYASNVGRWFEGAAFSPKKGQFAVTFVDVTERTVAEEALQESEQRFRRIVDSNMIGIAFIDTTSGRILEANDEFLRVAGRTKADLQAGTIDWQGVSVPESLENDHAAFAQVMRTGTATPFEKDFRRPDGSLVPAFVGGAALDARQQLAAAFVLDVSQHKKAQAVLASAARMAAAGQVAAHVAHEINNPLAGIRNSFLLIKGAVPATHPHFSFVGRIEKEIDRISRIIRRMYGLHRTGPLLASEFDLVEAVGDVVAMSGRSHRPDVAVRLGPCDRPLRVHLPEDAIRQVLFNVIRNAVDASPPRSEVTVRLEITPVLRILISDTGMGIPDHLRERIFEPLFTTKAPPPPETTVDATGPGARSALSPASDTGMGLGLWVCRNLVEAIGGRIDFTSRIGEGTTFVIELPAPGAGNGPESSEHGAMDGRH